MHSASPPSENVLTGHGRQEEDPSDFSEKVPGGQIEQAVAARAAPSILMSYNEARVPGYSLRMRPEDRHLQSILKLPPEEMRTARNICGKSDDVQLQVVKDVHQRIVNVEE